MRKHLSKIVVSLLAGMLVSLVWLGLVGDATWLESAVASPLRALVVGIGLAKEAASVVPNSNGTYDITYVIRVGNYSIPPQPLTNVQVQDDLTATFGPTATFVVVVAPAVSGGLTPNAAYDGSSDFNLLSGTNTVPITTTLFSITFTVRVTPNGFFGPYNNSAGGTANVGSNISTDTSHSGTNPDTNNNDNPTDNNTPTTISAIADPAVTKNGSPATAQIGDLVTFFLTVTNSCAGCNMTATNVIVTDVVPSFLTVLGATTTQGSASVTGNTVIVNVGNVPVNAVVLITIQTRANALALPPNNTNIATLTSPNDTNRPNNTPTATITVLAVAAPAQVPEGDTLWLVATGLAGLAGYARLRWRAQRARRAKQ
jgi:uncharacterized repeat protein (TIGR01451 family)